VGKSYRFLYGVKGTEHKDWEYKASLSDHNGYRGNTSFENTDSISYLCGGCHGTIIPADFLAVKRK
jgi:hypothetical protein